MVNLMDWVDMEPLIQQRYSSSTDENHGIWTRENELCNKCSFGEVTFTTEHNRAEV